MSKTTLLFAFWAAASGALIPVMAAMNGRLGKMMGNIPFSIMVPFAVALVGALLFILATKSPIPPAQAFSKIPPLYFAGGLIILFYVASVTYLTPHFGVANTIFFVVVAQIVSATIIDHFGLFGVDIQSLSLKRSLGILMLIAGVILARSSTVGIDNSN